VRNAFASGLLNALNEAGENGALNRRDELLKELQGFARAYPADAAVREWMAGGLVNALIVAKQEGFPNRRAELLEELRLLVRTYPADAAVRGLLAKVLGETMRQVAAEMDVLQEGEEEPVPPIDEPLRDLRKLGRDYPDDPVVMAIVEDHKDVIALLDKADGLDEVDGKAEPT
jgi:hypothetical protein